MTEFLKALSGTPVPIILIVAGVIFLAFAILQIKIKVKTVDASTPTQRRQIVSGIVGAIMIVAGVYLSTKSGPPQSPPATDTPTPNSAPAVATNTSPPEIATIPPQTPTVPSTPEVQTPEDFLHHYFALLTVSKDYTDAWGLLTKKFQKAFNSTGYGDYAAFWKTISVVDLNKIDVTWITTQSANCQVDMTLHTVSGFTDHATQSYFLVYDINRKTWMFDVP